MIGQQVVEDLIYESFKKKDLVQLEINLTWLLNNISHYLNNSELFKNFKRTKNLMIFLL